MEPYNNKLASMREHFYKKYKKSSKFFSFLNQKFGTPTADFIDFQCGFLLKIGSTVNFRAFEGGVNIIISTLELSLYDEDDTDINRYWLVTSNPDTGELNFPSLVNLSSTAPLSSKFIMDNIPDFLKKGSSL